MVVEEGQEGQVKGIKNIFDKIIAQNFPNVEKEMIMHVQEAFKTPKQVRPEKNLLTIYDH
jgi:hypothetical protein